MADIKISALPAAAALTGTELIPLVQSGLTVRSTATAIAALAGIGTTISVGYILAPNNTLRYNLIDNRITDNNGSTAIYPDSRGLSDSTGAIVFAWSTTANTFSKDLVPGAADTYAAGTTALRLSNVVSNQYQLTGSSAAIRLGINPSVTTPSGATADLIQSKVVSAKIALSTVSDGTADATATGDVLLESGNKTAGTGNSGNVNLNPGTSSGGTVGSVQILNDLTKLVVPKTVTAGGTTGNRTINKITGTVNIAAAGSSVTVTCAQCSTSSIVFAVVRTNDTTALIKNVVPGAGSFVITMNAAVTAETSIGFLVMN